MKLKRRLQAILLAGMMALTATTAAIPSFTTISAQAEDTNNDDWLHAVGSRLYDKDGNEVWLTGANWFGFNCGENCVHYLWMICFPKLPTTASMLFGCRFLQNC